MREQDSSLVRVVPWLALPPWGTFVGSEKIPPLETPVPFLPPTVHLLPQPGLLGATPLVRSHDPLGVSLCRCP